MKEFTSEVQRMFDGIRLTNERLIMASGLTLAGLLLKRTSLAKRLNETKLKDNAEPHIKNSEIALAYIGLLCQGKSDYDFIREMDRDQDFYCTALDIKHIPSSETLRQRLDMVNGQWNEIIIEENANLLKQAKVHPTPASGEYIPLDADVSPFDNSGTKKQGVCRTYKGVDGYAPIFAYLGVEGYLINAELRKGSTHCQNGTVAFLKKTILQAKQITDKPLLVRLDSGNDSSDNIELFYTPATRVYFIISRNLRSESPEMWLDIAKETAGKITSPREGKTVYTGSVSWSPGNLKRKVRIVYQVIVRTSKADGQICLIPELEVATWWTSLSLPENEIIELYRDHGTCEQFHSEIKTDMDLERLPSGKFETNSLILRLAMIAYNILRIIGQQSMVLNDTPIHKAKQRRRLRTVIQNLILLATRVVTHARRKYLNLGRSNAWDKAFIRIYQAFT